MSNGFVTGSARSVPGFDLYQAIESCSDLLENFGGHMYAAGLTMRRTGRGVHPPLQCLRRREHRPDNAATPGGDRQRTLLLEHHPGVPPRPEPFPAVRPRQPRTGIRHAGRGQPHGETKLVGADCEHLRMDLMQRQKPNTTIQTIAFQQPTHYEWIRAGHPIDVCYQIVENHYRASVSVQPASRTSNPCGASNNTAGNIRKNRSFQAPVFYDPARLTPAAAFRPNHSFPLPKRKNPIQQSRVLVSNY